VREKENCADFSPAPRQNHDLRLSGDIDFANSPEVRQTVLREIRESHTARVIVNLGLVRYIVAPVSLL